MNKSIERQILEIYSKVFNRVYSKTRLGLLARGKRDAILREVAIIESSEAYNEFAIKFGKELAKKGMRYQRGIWRKFYKAAKKLHYVALPHTYSEYEAQIMSKAVKHNFEMIKSIPRRTVEIMEHKYATTLIEEVAKGKLSRGSFMRELQSHGVKNARLIARTETAKLQTVIAETRARDLGSVAYEWRASHDKRTRPSHRDMDGVIVFWRDLLTEKPHLDGMFGNAGEFPNCRCAPQPIVDADQLTEQSYKVYDYRTQKIITISKNNLIKALQIGHLG